jgi:hypothetical protein
MNTKRHECTEVGADEAKCVIARCPAPRDEAIQLDRDECVRLGGHGALRAPRDDKRAASVIRVGSCPFVVQPDRIPESKTR